MLRLNGDIVANTVPDITNKVYTVSGLSTYMTDISLDTSEFKMPAKSFYNIRFSFTPTADINSISGDITTLTEKPAKDLLIPICTTRGISNNVLHIGTDGKMNFKNPDFPTCDIGEVHTVDFTYC